MRFGTLFAVVAALGVSLSAAAGPITVVGDGTTNNPSDPGNFQATFSYGYNAAQMVYQLTVTMKNTTASGHGNLTGFAFGGVSLANASLALSSVNGTGAGTDANWGFTSNVTWNPYGTFKYGATLPPNFKGGGNGSTQGINNSETGTFVFNVSGSGAGFLNEMSFLQNNSAGEFILVRFKGLDDDGDGSDHITGQLVIVPLPAPVWLGGAGLVGLLIFSRKRRLV